MGRALAATAMVAASVGTAAADVPEVAVTIPPVHALVARVMDGVGTPGLIVPPGASPHGYAMRPSEAALLERADVVVWIGPELEPWLEGPLAALAGDARIVTLGAAPGLERLEVREAGVGELGDHEEHGEHDDHAHGEGHDDHDHGDQDHGEHGHDEHADDEGHDDHSGHEDHADHGEHGHDHHGHSHDGTDPHFWLDPANAAAWLDHVAAALAGADLDNADAYRANAEAGKAELAALTERVAARAAALEGRAFLVFHDAYRYFEHRFGLEAAGSVTVDGRSIGAARLAALREAVETRDVACIFAEPQFPPRLAETIAEGTGARIGVLDPLGAGLTPGPDLYPALIEGMIAGIEDCLLR